VSSVAQMLKHTRVCVVGGSGGVGKTTSSAAVALGMAALGAKVAVVTIDPARRLADALGLAELGNQPLRVRTEQFAAAGLAVQGELWAMALDSKRTFDDLIIRLAPDAGTREQILTNHLYRQLSGAIAGSQEFTAVAKLHELAQRKDFDLLVLDTPPSRNALDFLDAPTRLTQFFEGRALRALLRPTGAGMRLLGRASGMMLALLGRVTGAQLLRDLSDFFLLLGGLLGGFRERAKQVEELLHDPATTFLLVSSAEYEPTCEAISFASQLTAREMSLAGAIVNRLHAPELADLDEREESGLSARELMLPAALAAKVRASFHDACVLARRDQQNVCRLVQALGEQTPVIRVPQLAGDVHDALGLVQLHRWLFAD
jgi:anion-transporting  ArsA/GET3 family ATPase